MSSVFGKLIKRLVIETNTHIKDIMIKDRLNIIPLINFNYLLTYKLYIIFKIQTSSFVTFFTDRENNKKS